MSEPEREEARRRIEYDVLREVWSQWIRASSARKFTRWLLERCNQARGLRGLRRAKPRDDAAPKG